MFVWDEKSGQVDMKGYVPLENAFILYGNLFVRPERCVSLIDDSKEAGRIAAIGSYLKGLPFHAFTIHVDEEVEEYDVVGMLERLRTEVAITTPAGSTTAIFTVPEKLLKKLSIPHMQSQRTMLLKKLTHPARLLPQGESRLITEADVDAITSMTPKIGMTSFQPNKLLEMPHLGLFDGTEPVALAGFHIYKEEFVEIGNIGTLPDYQGKGLATQITSDISRIGLEKSDKVYLCVFEDNLPAIRVYEKLGFTTVERYVFVSFLF